MTEALQRAIDALAIEDVSLRSVTASLAKGFEPKFDPQAEELEVELKHVLQGYEIVELVAEEAPKQKIFRVPVNLGIRWLRPSDDADPSIESDDNGDPESGYLASIEAVMVAEYVLEGSPGEDALRAFAIHNASFHVWPYWREYVGNLCLRMSLPRYTLPARQFATAPESARD